MKMSILVSSFSVFVDENRCLMMGILPKTGKDTVFFRSCVCDKPVMSIVLLRASFVVDLNSLVDKIGNSRSEISFQIFTSLTLIKISARIMSSCNLGESVMVIPVFICCALFVFISPLLISVM